MLRLEGIQVPMDHSDLRADLDLSPGRRVAILGPSGAGKSTLLDVIAGFRPATSGHLSWDGQDLTGLTPDKRPVSTLFQDGNLFPHLTLLRNLGLAVLPDGRRPTNAVHDQINAALDRVGLAEMAMRKPGQLSGGQQGRAALARVLLQARPVILLDEPFAALGPALKADMLDLVQEVATRLGALVLMVTHDPMDAKRFAQDVVLVADGQAAAPVDCETFFANPPNAFRAYIGDTE